MLVILGGFKENSIVEDETRTRTPFRARDFLTTIAFATLAVCSLEYTFTIAFALGVARLLSTPSGFPAWLGIPILQGSPTLSDSTLKVSL